jgi:3-deoxy-7-phosphoheptulonate synthase
MSTESSHPLADRAARPDGSCVRLGPVDIGGRDFAVIGGPCAVESASQIDRAARMVANAGVPLLRGGAFKPRTSPYSFQGLGKRGLLMLHECRRNLNLPVVAEVLSDSDIGLVERHADMLQVGARNMQNFTLLKALGRSRKPVLLKRGLAATVEEWLNAAEYILHAGNPRVVLCERGIRTYENSTRNTLDLNSVALLKKLTHLPVLVDPSHGTGRRELVRPLALAALAAGADGIIVEAHPNPDEAWSDGAQSLDSEGLEALMADLRRLAPLYHRRLALYSPDRPEEQIASCRRSIDALDGSIARLLEERARIGRLAGQTKSRSGRPVRDENREGEVLERVAGSAGDELSAAALQRMFRCIIDETRQVQECDAA